MTILYFILLLTLIICIHELGHFMAAKAFGVYVFEYSFGMGPVLFRKKGRETQFSIRAVPIGGYVAMAGETEGDEAYPDVVVPPGRRIQDKNVWQRLIIMLSGVAMNFVLAWVIFAMVLLSDGYYVQSPKPIVAAVQENSPAADAGFEAGDEILSITSADGASVRPEDYLDMQIFIAEYGDQELTYTVQRDDEVYELTVQPEYDAEAETYRIGIQGPEADVLTVNLLNCWGYSVLEMRMILRLLFRSLKLLIFGGGFSQLSGPVGIYSATETYASLGFATYMFLVGELSLNVALFNLLPLPVLDGGQAVILIGEAIARRPLSKKVRYALTAGCWILLLGIMVIATWNDIVRLFA